MEAKSRIRQYFGHTVNGVSNLSILWYCYSKIEAEYIKVIFIRRRKSYNAMAKKYE